MGPHALSPTGLSVAMVLGSHIIEEADLPEEESRKLPPRVVNVPSFGSVEEPPKRRATGGSTSGVTPYAGSGRGATRERGELELSMGEGVWGDHHIHSHFDSNSF